MTVHDLFFLKHPDMVEGEMRRDFVALVRDHVRRADGVLCVSEYTAAETRRLLDVPEEKIAVTPHGVDPAYREAPPEDQVDETLRRLRLPRGGVLYVGSAEKRKNLVTLVMAYMTLARRRRLPPLILAGPGSDWAQGGSRVGPQIVATGYLDKADVRALMAASSMLVLPSLEEGFGLPVVEAMAAGLPVVCSSGSALAEVAGDAACLVRAARRQRPGPRRRAAARGPGARRRDAPARPRAQPALRLGATPPRAPSPSTGRSLDARPLVVGIDARELAGRPTGTGRYLRNLLRHWREGGDRLVCYFNGPPALDPVLDHPAVRKRPLGDGGARGLVLAGAARCPRPRGRTGSTSSSPPPTPARSPSTCPG